jgi:hypothetical protein
MNKMKKLFLIIIFLPLLFNVKANEDSLVSKVQLNELQTKIQNLEQKIDKDSIALNNASTMIDISKEYSENADRLITRITWFIAFIIPLLGGGGFFGLWGFLKNRTKELEIKNEKTITLRLAEILNEKEEIILELINKHSNQKHLLSKSRILLLNKEGTTINENLITVLKNNCNEYKSKDIPDITACKFKYENYDMVILDNTNLEEKNKNWNFNDESLKGVLPKIVNDICSKDVAFLYFGPNDQDGGFSRVESLNKYAHLINFANSPSTAYTNILNLLSFRELLKKK